MGKLDEYLDGIVKFTFRDFDWKLQIGVKEMGEIMTLQEKQFKRRVNIREELIACYKKIIVKSHPEETPEAIEKFLGLVVEVFHPEVLVAAKVMTRKEIEKQSEKAMKIFLAQEAVAEKNSTSVSES